MNLEFYFDVGSPTAYLAYRRLRQLRERYAFALDYQPMLLGGVFKAAGSVSPASVPAKGRYMLEEDLPRFAQRYGVELTFNPFFPINTLLLMRGVYAARVLGCEEIYTDAVFRAIWIDGKNLADLTEVSKTIDAAGIDSRALLELAGDLGVKEALIDATQKAVLRGVFGAPTFFIGDEMFFGQDRLDFVEERLLEE